ncbi:MAG: ERAP1-like C-terminal domain-containing protein, partial [Nocardioidaceae bacterium]
GADLLLVNDDDLTYASVRPDAASLAALADQAAALPTATARGVAAITLYDLLMTGDAHPKDVVRCLADLVEVESSDSAVEPLQDMALQVVRFYAGEADRASLADRLATAFVTLAEQGGVRRRAGLRGLSQVATSSEHLDLLTAAAVEDVELAWRTLTRRSALGGYDADEVSRLLQRDPDPDAWARGVVVAAAQPDPEAKDRAWQDAFDEQFPLGTLYELSLAFWQPNQVDLLTPYADRFLAELPGLNDRAAVSARARSSWLFPFFGVDDTFAVRVEAHAAEPSTTPLIRSRLLDCVDRLRRMLRARQL